MVWKLCTFNSSPLFFPFLSHFLFSPLPLSFHHAKTKPPVAGAFAARKTNPTQFRKFYERGDFPIALDHDPKGNKIAWKVCAVHLYLSIHPSIHLSISLSMYE